MHSEHKFILRSITVDKMQSMVIVKFEITLKSIEAIGLRGLSVREIMNVNGKILQGFQAAWQLLE